MSIVRDHLALALMTLIVVSASWNSLQSAQAFQAGPLVHEDLRLGLQETRGEDNGKFSLSQKRDLLLTFFTLEGYSFDSDDEKLVNRYSDSAIELISQYLKSETNKEKLNDLNAQFSLTIYESELNKLMASKADQTAEGNLDHEAAIRTLELILPGNGVDGMDYKMAVNELDRCLTSGKRGDLCKELLDKIIVLLGTKECFTDHVARLMRHFHYHWIPLVSLMELIEPDNLT